MAGQMERRATDSKTALEGNAICREAFEPRSELVAECV